MRFWPVVVTIGDEASEIANGGKGYVVHVSATVQPWRSELYRICADHHFICDCTSLYPVDPG